MNKFSEDGFSSPSTDNDSDNFSSRKPRRSFEEYTPEMLAANREDVLKAGRRIVKLGAKKTANRGANREASSDANSDAPKTSNRNESRDSNRDSNRDANKSKSQAPKRSAANKSKPAGARSKTNPHSPNNPGATSPAKRTQTRPPKAPTGFEHLLGTRIELEVSGFAHGGFGVARTDDGRVVFVSDAIPGETVAALIADVSNKSFWYADTVEVLKPSADRVEHFWPEASVSRHPATRAGGANLGHIALDRQRALKAEVLADALVRFGKLEEDLVKGLFSQSEQLDFVGFNTNPSSTPGLSFVRPLNDENGLHWRTRIKVRADIAGNLGVFSPRSHNHVAVESFPLASQPLLENAPFGQTFEGIETLDLISSSTNEHRLVIDEVPSSRVLHEGVTWTRADGSVADHVFDLAENGFWQVHQDAPRALAQVVSTLIDPTLNRENALNLDLYAGVGLFTTVLAETLGEMSQILSVEIDKRASNYAESNVQMFPNVSVVNSDVQRFLVQEARKIAAEDGAELAASYRAGTVLLDPPRSGAGRKVVDLLGQLRPAQVVYVACDPVALARDIAYFSAQGFELKKLVSLDMFPNTHHFESVAVFA